MKIMIVVVLAAALFAAGACGGRKQHLANDYAKSYDAVFGAQRERTQADPASAVSGLDSQEAAIISDGFRASLAPKGQKATEEPVILYSPQTRDRLQPLAPSVPSVPPGR
jgi:hypothetical protein